MNVDLIHKLDSVYDRMRKLQAQHNMLETRCIGSGICCKIGLRIPLAECYNIAFNLKKEYLKLWESEGKEVADNWWHDKIQKLLNAFDEPNWSHENPEAVDKHCAFYENGCSIYSYRPMVCRAYGVIMPVKYTCPRKRLSDGGHELFFGSEEVESMLDSYDEVIDEFADMNPDELDYTVYMPFGVLRFLLGKDKLLELIKSIDPKFTLGVPGNPHVMHYLDWQKESESEV
jgi:Fe-S-cluster containining protein